MAYADPQATHNPTTGTSPPAAWGDIVRDDLEWLARNAPTCRAYHSAAIVIANGVPTAIGMDSERWDIGGMHSTATNISRITVPSGGDGKYDGVAYIAFVANATGVRGVSVRVNGSLTIANLTVPAASGVETTFAVPWDWALVAGDYIEMVVFQTSGGNLNVAADLSYSPELSAHWKRV